MNNTLDDDLYQRTKRLLEPGEIELVGAIVHTELGSTEDIEMHQATVDIGEIIAEGAGIEPTDTYVYSGSEDTNFASNQHQGLTLANDGFVWECQQQIGRAHV